MEMNYRFIRVLHSISEHLSEITILEDKSNPLLGRREIVCILKGYGGKLKRAEAANLIAEKLSISNKLVLPVRMVCKTGIQDLHALFYIYENEESAKKDIPKYIFTRLRGKEEKKEAAPAAKEG